jgi:hypothetical protein
MMIEDWEVGAFYWRMVNKGAAPNDAAEMTRKKFLNELCGPKKDTHFFVGTILAHPTKWVVIGVFWPTIATPKSAKPQNLRLFDMNGQ